MELLWKLAVCEMQIKLLKSNGWRAHFYQCCEVRSEYLRENQLIKHIRFSRHLAKILKNTIMNLFSFYMVAPICSLWKRIISQHMLYFVFKRIFALSLKVLLKQNQKNVFLKQRLLKMWMLWCNMYANACKNWNGWMFWPYISLLIFLLLLLLLFILYRIYKKVLNLV